MTRTPTGLMVRAAVAALALCAVTSAGAAASPAWRFGGKELSGSEAIAGNAPEGRLFFSSTNLTTTCKETQYKATIHNSGGKGLDEVTSMTFKGCTTNQGACSVSSILAEALPWSGHLVTVGTDNYLVIEGVKATVAYSGEECVVGGTEVVVTGSAGGLYLNKGETITFSSSTYPATGTELKALGKPAEWKGVFSTEATGTHHGEALTVS
jgi:hypothetical protein